MAPTIPDPSPAAVTAARIADAFAADPSILAVAWSGSWTTGFGEDGSDIDLYVYADREPPLAPRTEIAARFSASDTRAELDNRFWEPGDEWRDAASGLWIDIMYRSPAWVETELARVLDRHEASTGYTTCFWHNVLTSRSLFDRHGWFGQLQHEADRPYPDELRQAIVAKNLPLLSQIHSSYRTQIAVAIRRGDQVAVNHRIAALLASVFDIVFAVNRVPHPGEKRQVAYAAARCPVLPVDFGKQVDRILAAAWGGESLLNSIDQLATQVERLVAEASLTTTREQLRGLRRP